MSNHGDKKWSSPCAFHSCPHHLLPFLLCYCVMAEVAVIGWLVSPVIEAMIDSASSYVLSKFLRGSDMEEDLHNLKTTLVQILAVVAAAEKRRWRAKDATRSLLRQMKDAVYEAEDLLDEFDYLLLRSQVRAGTKVSRLTATPLLTRSRRALRSKLKTVLSKLDRANSCAERFLQASGLGHDGEVPRLEAMPWRATSSFLLEDRILGRDKERDQVVRLLLDSGDQDQLVVSIIGEGGMGKTTLAQVVYNDERVVTHFDLKIWICVSDSFSEVRLTREILSSATSDADAESADFNLNKLQEVLQSKLSGKKFLLVLDDVWLDEKMEVWQNRDRWKKILAPLRFGRRGSKILATTRSEIVAKMFDAASPITLKGLEDDDCWSLFKIHAFGSTNLNSNPEMEKIGRQIAKRLKGSPLGVKVIGGMLSADSEIDEWKSVLETDVYSGIMPVLRLSYQNLPPHLQQCFAYCSIFPKDWEFEQEKLVYMWMAQGFIQPEDGTKMEVAGRTYFNDLLSRSFFQRVEKDDGRMHFVMHDLMHDLAQVVSKDECFCVEGDTWHDIPLSIRHLSINKCYQPQLSNLSELKNLRTLVFINSDYILQSYVFKELASLRVLDLTGCSMEELPQSIGHLIHLRYLGLCDTLSSLPTSLCKLYHLQVILASKWCWSGQFPAKMNKLISLRHLNVHINLVSKIRGIGKLTHLQELPEFHVSRENGHRIDEIMFMNELQGSLIIKDIENVNNQEEALGANLRQKKHIKELHLEWSPSDRTKRYHLGILESLQPHSNLEVLDITGYMGCESPSWLVMNWMHNLESICLTKCKKWKLLPPFGQLPYLKVLKIRGMHAVEHIGPEFYGTGELKGFPSLEYLFLQDMPFLAKWCEDRECKSFPLLHKLEIKDCPQLKELPIFTSALTSILIRDTITYIDFSPLVVRQPQPCFSLGIDLSPLIVCQPQPCFSLEVDGKMDIWGDFLHHHQFEAVALLKVRCAGPISIEKLERFISLRKLIISFCSELLTPSAFSEDGNDIIMPSSLLAHLILEACGFDDQQLSRCLCNLTSLATLDIHHCQSITCLPPAKVFCRLTALQKLHIAGCKRLSTFGGFKDLTSLEHLRLTDCPKLLVSATADRDVLNQSAEGFLPSSLLHLEINACGFVDASLSRSLQSLRSLTNLKIKGCLQITSLPPKHVLCQLTSLSTATIDNCQNLRSLGGLEALIALKKLNISDCPRVEDSPSSDEDGESCSLLPSSLQYLEIRSCGFSDQLLFTCLQNQINLSSLTVEGCDNITSIPTAGILRRLIMLREVSIEGCSNLESCDGLPALVSLEDLNVERCPKLDSVQLLARLQNVSTLKSLSIMDGAKVRWLPDSGLPPSLEYFSLLNCHPTLKEQLTRKEGPEWRKIAHVSGLFY